jgi:hypothetical protein
VVLVVREVHHLLLVHQLPMAVVVVVEQKMVVQRGLVVQAVVEMLELLATRCQQQVRLVQQILVVVRVELAVMEVLSLVLLAVQA